MEQRPTLEVLYPGLSADELLQAESNLARYLALVLQIQARLQNGTHGCLDLPPLLGKMGTLSCTSLEASPSRKTPK